MKRYVWFKTQRQNGAGKLEDLGRATRLERVDDEIVDAFCDRVRAKMSPTLNYCAANQLVVHVLDAVGRLRVLDEDAAIPDTASNKANALVVNAPPLSQPTATPLAAADVTSEYSPPVSSMRAPSPRVCFRTARTQCVKTRCGWLCAAWRGACCAASSQCGGACRTVLVFGFGVHARARASRRAVSVVR